MTNKKQKTRPLYKFTLLLVIVLTLFSVIFLGGRSILKTLYPVHYDEFVEVFAKENNLSPFFVFAVIKCESNFNKDAVSYADARGLMQILPSSFSWLLTKTGEKLDEEMLFDPHTSIKYGCYLYGMLLEEFQSEAVAVAAYHAGQGNVRKWLKDSRYSKDGKTLYEIPFGNTKTYVERVTRTKEIYELLYSRSQ